MWNDPGRDCSGGGQALDVGLAILPPLPWTAHALCLANPHEYCTLAQPGTGLVLPGGGGISQESWLRPHSARAFRRVRQHCCFCSLYFVLHSCTCTLYLLCLLPLGSREFPDFVWPALKLYSPGNNRDSAGGPVLADVWHLQPEIPQGEESSQIFPPTQIPICYILTAVTLLLGHPSLT